MENVNYNKVTKLYKARKIVSKTLIYTFLGIAALFVLFPFYWMILTSFKTYASYNAEFKPKFYASDPTLANYYTAFTSVNLAKYLANTVIFAVITTALMTIISILAAFAFARLKFKGRELVFTLFLALMMIPTELVVITNYTTIVNLHLRNTFIGLILPSVMSVFYVYLLRQTFMGVPDELYYAAKVDGKNDFTYLMKVLVPIAKPTIESIIILKLIECWNSFVWPRLITTNEDYYLVSNAINVIKTSGFGRENIPAMMAAVVVVSAPLLIIYLIFRRQIMAGVARSGIKG